MAVILSQMVMCVTATFTKAEQKQFVKQGLEQHNRLRSLHQARALKWDPQAERMAQRYADLAAQAGSYNLLDQFRPDHAASVTLCMNDLLLKRCTSHACCNASFAAEFFYEERRNYNYSSGAKRHDEQDPREQILHFTQIVWKATTHIGFARLVNETRCFMIFLFRPAGNVGSPANYLKNISPPPGYNSSPARRSSFVYSKAFGAVVDVVVLVPFLLARQLFVI